jgi:zinc/manganese transport system permease protein
MFSTFMVNTWIGATLVAIVAGMIGFFVVLRGSSFAAHALPLGTFPGAAAATLPVGFFVGTIGALSYGLGRLSWWPHPRMLAAPHT